MKTAETINGLRENLEKDYDSTLPEYLEQYLDGEIKNKPEVKDRGYTQFWKEEEFELTKKYLWNKNTKFKETSRNSDRVEQERNLTKEEVDILISICEHDLYLFAIRYCAHYLKKPSNELHRYLYEYISTNLGKQNRKKGFKHALAAPRAYAKSTLISAILPLWCIAYNKKRFIIICSDTASQAEDFLSDIKRELEFNDLLKRDFPHLATKGPVWRTDEIITKNDIKVKVLGTGSKIRGRRFGIYRPDLVINDDLESSDMVRSRSMREFVRYEWFNKDLLYVGGEEDSPCDILVVGTILGKDSLLNALLNPNEYPDWTSRKFKAVLKFSTSDLWDEWGDLYKNRFDPDRIETARKFFLDNVKEMLAGTEVLWPEGEPYYDLMVFKLSNPSGFNSEKQNSVIDESKILVHFKQLHFEDFSTNETIQKILLSPKNSWYGFLDPSLGRHANRGDFSCITTICRDSKSGYLYVVDFNIKRRKVDDQIDAILDDYEKFKYKIFGVETNAFQLVVADNLRKKSRKLGYYVPIKDVVQSKDKKMRVEGIVPLIIDGTIVFDTHLYNSSQQYNLAIEQTTTFTGENDAHDDAPDSLASCVSMAKKKIFRLITKQTR